MPHDSGTLVTRPPSPVASSAAPDGREAALLALLLLYCGTVGVFVAEYTFFFSDDFGNLRLARTLPLADYLVRPIDIHFVPMHRLFVWVLQKLSPLNYPLAVAALLACHGLTMLLLKRLFDLIRPSRLNLLLLVVYSANIFFAVPLAWFTSGVHRFPCLLFTVASLYYAARFAAEARPLQFLASVLAALLALGFYAKALLLPAYVLGLALCFAASGVGGRWRRMLPIAAVQIALAGGYVLFRHYSIGRLPAEPPPPRGLYDVVVAMFSIFSEGLLALRFHTRTVPEGWVVPVVFVVAGWTIWRSPRNAVVWLVAAAWFALNALLLTMGRGFAFGIWATLVYRYYFELVFFVVITAKIVLTNIDRAGAPAPWAARLRDLLATRRALFAVAVYLVVALSATLRLLAASQQHQHVTRLFLRNLLADTAHARATTSGKVSLLDAWFSPEMRKANAYNLTSYSDFFAFTGAPPAFNDGDGRLFHVAADGHLLPLILEPDPLRITLTGLKLELPFEASELAAGKDGCLNATSFRGGTLLINVAPLPAQPTLVGIEYANEEPTGLTLSVFDAATKSWRRVTEERFVLPAGAGEKVLIATYPGEAAATRLESVRLELPLAAAPACVKALRISGYKLGERP